MKKLKLLLSITISISILIVSIIPVFADVTFVVDGYTYAPIDSSYVELRGYDIERNGTDLLIPNTVYSRFVGAVSEYAFQNSQITSVSFDRTNELSTIKRYAFYNCDSLTYVKLPARVKNLERGIFRDCDNLKTVDFFSRTELIPREAFSNCSSMEQVTISDSVKTIEAFAFSDCVSLAYLELKPTIAYIDNYAFSGCDNLTLGVWYGSYAHQYAKDNNIPYVLLDGVKLANANGDGYVNINDVTAIQRHIADLEFLDEIYLYAADINRDGAVDITDATELQRYLAEFDVDYPIGEVITQ